MRENYNKILIYKNLNPEKEIEKKEQGITLISLVIMIVVLIILASISIAALTSGNNLLNKTGEIKDDAERTAAEEDMQIAFVEAKNREEKNGTPVAETMQKILKQYDTNVEVSESIDEAGKKGIYVKYKGFEFNFENSDDIISGNTELGDEGNKIYAKLYSYKDGSGDVLEFSSNKYYVDSSSDLELKANYGNIINNHYIHTVKEETKTENGIKYTYSTYSGTPPEWLEHTVTTNENDLEVTIRDWYVNNTIKKVIIVDNIKPLYLQDFFYNCYKLEEIEGIEKINTSKVKCLNTMFTRTKIKSLDLSSWDISNVTDMAYFLNSNSSIKTLKFGEKWNNNNIRNFQGCFLWCTSLNDIDFPENFVTNKCTNIYGMFTACFALTDLDLSRMGCIKCKKFYRTFLFM